MKTCDICNRYRFRFIDKDGRNVSAVPIFSEGETFFVCLECSLNYFSQVLKFSEPDISFWLDFVTSGGEGIKEKEC